MSEQGPGTPPPDEPRHGPGSPWDPPAAGDPAAGASTPPYGQPAPYGPPPPYGAAPYGAAPPYGAPYGHEPPHHHGTDGFAIASLVTAFFCTPLGLVFGFVSLSRIKRTGRGGRGLAIAGIVISAVGILAAVALYAFAATVSFGP